MGHIVSSGLLPVLLLVSPLAIAQDLTFKGACDASAAIVLASGDLAVADDENPDVIRRYGLQGGTVTATPTDALETWLGQDRPKQQEADLEGAAVVGERVYWIGSHGRGSHGEPEPARRMLFATNLDLEPVGTPYTQLLDDVARADKLWGLGLAAAIDNPEVPPEQLAPEVDGLSFEALGRLPAATGGRARDSVLVGLRNPAGGDGRALLLPIRNIDAVATSGAAPEFGEPIRLDLDGLRVRDLAWWEARRTMLVLAGTKDDHADFRLYAWSGARAASPNLVEPIEGLWPEAVVPLGSDRVLLLSDDGDVRSEATVSECKQDKLEDGQCRCKHLLDQDRQSFRGRVMMLK